MVPESLSGREAEYLWHVVKRQRLGFDTRRPHRLKAALVAGYLASEGYVKTCAHLFFFVLVNRVFIRWR